MNPRSLTRDLALLAFAAALGWWAHGANRNPTVHAATPPPQDLTFQFQRMTNDTWLTLYDPATRNLYVYPSAVNSSAAECSYSLHVDHPGATIERHNCAPGSTH